MPNEKSVSVNGIQDQASEGPDSDSTDEELLDAYLAMPKKLRDRQFVDTASASEIAEVSQRTIQLWIESGVIRAVRIGKKYRVNHGSLIAYLKSRARPMKR